MRIGLVPPAALTLAATHAEALAGCLRRWGHAVEITDPADANPAVPDAWFIYATADPFPLIAATNQVRFVIDPSSITQFGIDALGRQVALWNADLHTLIGGTVVGEFRDCPYRHPFHFTFTHPWEIASRNQFLTVGRGDVFLDIGSSIGSWSLPAAARGAYVYAFDPGTDASALRRLAAENGFRNIHVDGRFVAEASGRPVARTAIPWLSVPAEAALGDTTTVSIDDFVAEAGLPGVSLIKIDVDGGEINVLAGMARTLDQFRCPVVVETHTFLGVSIDEVSQALDTMRYRVADILPMEDAYYYHVYGVPRA